MGSFFNMAVRWADADIDGRLRPAPLIRDAGRRKSPSLCTTRSMPSSVRNSSAATSASERPSICTAAFIAIIRGASIKPMLCFSAVTAAGTRCSRSARYSSNAS
jgi:hypothetical protein